MKTLKLFLLSLIIPLLGFTSAHKYYVSNTQIEYKEVEKELQIISRIFIDDFEKLIRMRYDESVTLAKDKEPEIIDQYISKYIKEKLSISVNKEAQQLTFLGKEYEDDMVWCYFLVNDVDTISSFQVSNKVLFDLYQEQQNIVRTKIYSKNKSFILISGNDKGMLNFN